MTMREREAPLAGRYELRRMLGQGGMARVYAAHDLMLNRVVAIKQLQPSLANDRQARERFLREGRLVAGLSHRGIACVYDVVDAEEGAFLVQELIRGRDLDSLLPLPHGQALEIVASLADTLAFIHQNDIVHCDVKPQNVILADDGRPVLIDFGIAEPQGAEVKQLLGTPQYVSPERVQGAPPTPASDVYGLGVMLYELLTGHVPLDGSTPQEIIRRHIHEGVPPLRQAAPGMATAVEELLARATNRDPAARPSMTEMATEIRSILEAATRQTSVIPVVRHRNTLPINNMATQAVPAVYEPSSAPPAPPDTLGARVTRALSRIMPRSTGRPQVVREPSPAHRMTSRPVEGGWAWPQRNVLLALLLVVPLLLGLALLLRSSDRQQAGVADVSRTTSDAAALTAQGGEATKTTAGGDELSWPEVSADNFDAATWAQGEKRRWSLAHAEGRYRMAMEPGLGMLYSLSNAGPLPDGDVAVSVDVEPKEGAGGLLFGFLDEMNHYRLVTTPDGTYQLERRVGGAVESLMSGDGAGAGRLTLGLQGQTARVYNGEELLGEAQLPEAVRGAYGFVLVGDGAAAATFDNLSIRKAP